jgi:hypothetical protein
VSVDGAQIAVGELNGQIAVFVDGDRNGEARVRHQLEQIHRSTYPRVCVDTSSAFRRVNADADHHANAEPHAVDGAANQAADPAFRAGPAAWLHWATGVFRSWKVVWTLAGG